MAGPNGSLDLVCPMGVQTFPPRNLFARRILGFVFLPEAEFVNWISWRGVPNEVPVVAHERWHQAFRDAIQGDASSAGLVVEVSVRVRTCGMPPVDPGPRNDGRFQFVFDDVPNNVPEPE